VTFENCWAFYNGFSHRFERIADGNGFKAGGYGATPVDELPRKVPRHVVRFCLAVHNKANGFYANHHLGGDDWINNTAYRNAVNFNMLCRLMDNATDVDGFGHLLRNNIGYKSGTEISNFNRAKCDSNHNSFDMKLDLKDDDFASLDESELTRPRKPNGDLPEIRFLHPSDKSELIDRGEDVGFPFHGARPELGAFEK